MTGNCPQGETSAVHRFRARAGRKRSRTGLLLVSLVAMACWGLAPDAGLSPTMAARAQGRAAQDPGTRNPTLTGTEQEPNIATLQNHTLYLPLTAYNHNPMIPFGMQILSTDPTHTDISVELGASVIRIPLWWATIEPQNTAPDHYGWSAGMDAILQTMAVENVDAILTIHGNPGWAATSEGGPVDKVPIGELVEFAVAAVERYSKSPYNVRFFELYNEPDNGDPLYSAVGLGYWGHEPEAYAEMLAAVYPAIKAANPNVQVLIGGLAYDWFEEEDGPFVRDFLDRVLQAGGGAYFDMTNFHYYPAAFSTRWNPYGPGLVGKTNFLRDLVASYGLQKPIICTEVGAESVNTGTPETQSRWLARAMIQALPARLVNTVWFMLVDEDQGYWKTGLFTYDMIPKPAYSAYQTAVRHLALSRYVRTLSAAETGSAALEVHEFVNQRDGSRLLAGWTNDDLAHVLELMVPGVIVVDKYDNRQVIMDLSDGRPDGRTHVTMGPSPVYIYPGK